MITPGEIIQKAGRLYLPFLRSWVQGEHFFPLSLPAGSLPLSRYAQLRTEVQLLTAQSKEQRGYGYSIEFERRRTRNYEPQNLPKRIIIETEQDFLRLLAKEQEFTSFQQDVSLIRQQQPCLHTWIIAHPQRVIDCHKLWPDLLAVCTYFVEHPRPGCYLRELPVRVHTKFVEQHAGILRELLETLLPPEAIQRDAKTFAQRFGLRDDEPLVRVRLLDKQLFTYYGLPLTDLSMPYSQFSQLTPLQTERCIVTENKMVFLTLPHFPRTFAIFGEGFTVRSLSAIPWLAYCPIFYWGDLDAQGFQILSLLRATFPHVISLMMDEATLHTFADFCVEGTPCPLQQLPHLTPEEHTLFQHLARENRRLEQEHIDHAYALQRLRVHLQGDR
ncbi:MAG TPA: Wadjet anti-phage system protein JetD domain-containing protein [Ktedonobacteraceae bacterium]|nr:Wadjet anti-phage system protein JetD domain-containing protein [Ktedonobacteraceae bacterium]